MICIKGSYYGLLYIFNAKPNKYIYFKTICDQKEKADFKFEDDVYRSVTTTRRDG